MTPFKIDILFNIEFVEDFKVVSSYLNKKFDINFVTEYSYPYYLAFNISNKEAAIITIYNDNYKHLIKNRTQLLRELKLDNIV